MKFGLRAKIILIPILFLLVVLGVNTFLAAWHVRIDYGKSLHDNVRTVAQNLRLQADRLLQLGIRADQIAGFDQQCREVLAQHPEFSYAMLVARDGKILAHSHPAAAGAAWPAVPRDPAETTVLSDSPDRPGDTFHNVALPLTDPSGEHLGWCVVGYPAAVIESKIWDVTFWSILSVAILCPLAILVMSVALGRTVTRPLSKLLHAVDAIREKGACGEEVRIQSDDELGRLALAFNAMAESIRERDRQILRQLHEVESARDLLEQRVQERTADLTRANADLHAEMERRRDAERRREQMQANLMEASRRAGMADVATGVLHNVGNVLNSINVSTQVVQDAVRGSRATILAKATDLLQQHAHDLPQFLTADDRGRQLPAFLARLSDSLQEERKCLLGELNNLGSSINHIREIVSMQQSLARVAGVHAEVAVAELLDDALKINQGALERHHVAIHRDIAPGLALVTDRHKVLQILINLVSNAKHAVDSLDPASRALFISARKNADRILIAVRDNGVGIDPDAMPRLFNFGFTTKKNGHGFGLHSAAIAARELGGILDAHSDGPGTGATFTLTLPLTREAPVATPS